MGRENKQERVSRNVHRHEVKDRRKAKKDARESVSESKARRTAAAAAEEEDIDKVLKELEQDRARLTAVETHAFDPGKQPQLRANATLVDHPVNKDEMVLFGGAYYDGERECVYDDLLIYNAHRNQWRAVRSPTSPAPRCGHAAATRASLGGQMFVIGGEFASRSGANFRHYGDTWMFSFAENKWDRIDDRGTPPTPRSGHRTVILPGRLVLFGGFFDNARGGVPRYFNDMYVLDLAELTWSKTVYKATDIVPNARSACQMCPDPCSKNAFLLFGGYSTSRVKGGLERGHVHSDVWRCELSDDRGWVWSSLRPAGPVVPTKWSGFSIASCGTLIVGFGGASDVETDDSLKGSFSNDLYGYDAEKNIWYTIETERGRETKERQQQRELDKRTRALQSVERKRVAKREKQKQMAQNKRKPAQGKTSVEKPKSHNSSKEEPSKEPGETSATELGDVPDIDGAWPCPRMNANIVLKGKTLYLYGGVREEENESQVTFGDMYILELSRSQGWELISETLRDEWRGDEKSSSESDDSDESDED